jgi:glyoxylase-like metal-dependent hydrolase (beta-lactamase superfamily II)
MSHHSVEKFAASSGARIYRIPMTVFPNGFIAYSFLVLESGPPTLIDAGSGFVESNQDLLRGIQAVRDDFGEAVTLQDIQQIIVSHGHIDHHGGVAFVAEQIPDVQIGIHELDRRVLTSYEERLTMASKDIEVYLERAGIDSDRREGFMMMYSFAKQHVTSVDVHFSMDEEQPRDGMSFYHVPGHCPGQVCIMIDDVLLSTDHILSRTTPHQAPESITHYTGLGHYTESLKKIRKIEGIRLAIGSHEEAIDDVYTRIDDIMHSHERKLERVLEIVRAADAPCTIDEITQRMYPGMEGYQTLLALEEAGAHIEYLYQHGRLSVANLDEVERKRNPPLRYTAVS